MLCAQNLQLPLVMTAASDAFDNVGFLRLQRLPPIASARIEGRFRYNYWRKEFCHSVPPRYGLRGFPYLRRHPCYPHPPIMMASDFLFRHHHSIIFPNSVTNSSYKASDKLSILGYIGRVALI